MGGHFPICKAAGASDRGSWPWQTQSLTGTPARLGQPGTVALCPLPAQLPPCGPWTSTRCPFPAAYAWASDTRRGGPEPQSLPVQPVGEAGRLLSSRFSDNVTLSQRRPEGGMGRACQGKLSLGLPELLYPPPAHFLRCQRPAESQPLRARRAGRRREREGWRHARCGPSHVRGGSGEGSCSRCPVPAQESPPGFAFRVRGRPLSQFLVCNWTPSSLGLLQRKKPAEGGAEPL